MYKIKLSSGASTYKNTYYFVQKPTSSERLGACLEYFEFLVVRGGWWKAISSAATGFRFYDETEYGGRLVIDIHREAPFRAEVEIRYNIEKLKESRPLNAFLTSSHPKIREFVKGSNEIQIRTTQRQK